MVKTRKTAKSKHGGTRAGAGRKRFSEQAARTAASRRNKKYNDNCVSIRVPRATHSALTHFQNIVKAPNMSSALSQALKYYSAQSCTRRDAQKINGLQEMGDTASQEAMVLEQSEAIATSQWTDVHTTLARRLHLEGKVTVEAMPVVLALSQKLWTGVCNTDQIPCATSFRKWFDERMDSTILQEQLADISMMHLAVDGSKKMGEKRYVLRASYLNSKAKKPTI